MRVRGVIRAALAGVWLAGVGCGGAGGEAVRIDGSVGVRPLVEVLVEEYRQASPDTRVELGEGMGSGERLRALAAGEIDVAMASHGLVAEEIARQGMVVNEIARVAVVFGVHEGVPLTSLTAAEVCAVFGGEITRWSELGGPDLPIAPLVRPPEEVDDEVVTEKLPCWRGLRRPETVRVIVDPSELAAEVASTPGAIGVTTMTLVEQSGGRIRALALDGVAPDSAAVSGGDYDLVREFFLVTMEPPPGAVADFLDFVRGPAGERVIRANGAVPTR